LDPPESAVMSSWRAPGVGGGSDRVPPAADRLHRELAGVSVGAHVHPAAAGAHVIHPVRHCPAQVALEVMHQDRFGPALRLPFLPAVLEVADQLFFLGVHADYRFTGRREPRHQLIDKPELPVPVRVLLAFHRLGVALQAVTLVFQQPPDGIRRHRMTRRGELVGQLRCRLGGPPQRRLRVAASLRIHKLGQRRYQARIHLLRRAPARPGPAHPPIGLDLVLQFPRTPADGIGMNSRQLRHPLDPAPAQRPRLRPQQQTPLQLIQMRPDLRQHPHEPVLIHHQLSHTTTVASRLRQTCLIQRRVLTTDLPTDAVLPGCERP
jgi:hypothetical protein